VVVDETTAVSSLDVLSKLPLGHVAELVHGHGPAKVLAVVVINLLQVVNKNSISLVVLIFRGIVFVVVNFELREESFVSKS